MRLSKSPSESLPGATNLEAALARIHGCHKHETGGEAQRHIGARNGDRAVFERLPEYLQHVARKLGEFIEKQQAIVRQADFARTRHARAAADRSEERRVGQE